MLKARKEELKGMFTSLEDEAREILAEQEKIKVSGGGGSLRFVTVISIVSTSPSFRIITCFIYAGRAGNIL